MTDRICCARLKSALTHERGELARLARNASRRQARGLIVTDKARADIEATKVAIAETLRNMENHEADHAGEAEVA